MDKEEKVEQNLDIDSAVASEDVQKEHNKKITLKLNRDNLKTKEEQLNELNTDYQNHISKMQQLLSFFAATLALVF